MKDQSKKQLTKVGWLLFYLYIILLSYFLFLSDHYGRGAISEEYRYNLELFKEIKRFFRYRELLGFESFVVNILGNVIAFAPYGFLLPLLNKRYRGFFIMAFLSILFSVTVEVVQMLLRVGVFDVDDILLNSIGGILGYVFFAVCHKIYLSSRTRVNNKKQ